MATLEKHQGKPIVIGGYSMYESTAHINEQGWTASPVKGEPRHFQGPNSHWLSIGSDGKNEGWTLQEHGTQLPFPEFYIVVGIRVLDEEKS